MSKIKIDNEKAAGKFASGFKYNVLEAKVVGDTIIFRRAQPIYPDGYRAGKMNTCYMEIEKGCVYSGYAKRKFEWLGGVEKDLQEATTVMGETFDIREELKEFGLKWNRELKVWEKLMRS